MSRYALQRMAPLLHGRMQLRWYPRPLSSAAEQPSTDAVHMTDNCIRRLKELHTTGSSNEGKMLRLGVETGGCSGFQYVFCLDDMKNEDDRVFDKDGVKLVVDNVSYDFVKGATVDYVEELIRSAFLVSMAELLEQKDWENWLLDIKMQMDDSEGLTLGRKFCMYVFSRRTWSISVRRIAVDES